MDFYSKAVNLLESVANSIHERDPKNLVCFTSTEVQVVEKWLESFIEEKPAEHSAGHHLSTQKEFSK